MAETKSCPKCGKTAYHNQGISNKTGKPYENWKCGDKSCDYIEWLEVKSKPSGRVSDAERAQGQARGAAFNKSVDVAIAMYQKGDISKEQLVPMVVKVFAQFLKINGENSDKAQGEVLPEVNYEVS